MYIYYYYNNVMYMSIPNYYFFLRIILCEYIINFLIRNQKPYYFHCPMSIIYFLIPHIKSHFGLFD